MSRLPVIILLFSSLMALSMCHGAVGQKIVHVPPTLCLGWPCDVPVHAVTVSGEKNRESPIKNLMLSAFAHKRNIVPLNRGPRQVISPRSFRGVGLYGGSHRVTLAFRGEGIFPLSSHGLVVKTDTRTNSCARAFPMDRTTLTLGEADGHQKYFGSVYFPRTSIVIMDRIPRPLWRRYAALFRCLAPLVLRSPVVGEVEALRAFGVTAFALGKSAQGTVFARWLKPHLHKAIYLNLGGGILKEYWHRDAMDLLVQLQRGGHVSRGVVYRVFEELMREGIKPGRFVEISRSFTAAR
ncbi:hypothetical protein KKF84_00940 [Myxococcota bacterium]|nr:hypothetical protein [Myxococcota bacterium]MBU1533851.1 hypothetical protein [Myxococcota bacterium]